MSTILDTIVDYKRQWVRERKSRVPESALLEQARGYAPRPFASAMVERIVRRENAVIAEVKKASPSKGVIREDFDPVAIARAYAAHGATCLSVLTDERFFQGCDRYLADIRSRVALPILRKDFMLDPYQVLEARAMGADAILVILAMVDDTLAAELCAAAREQGLSILPEVHNREELERALSLDTELVGINNRDLRTFDTTLDTTIDLLPHIPAGRYVVTESGIHGPADVARMNRAGIHGFLVGESLMRAPDPGEALEQLLATPS
ncbi:MAG TPA: indole-3-glycerol phosphate synthase TrpC [Mariprofundaceae bacterium]|nr:indole-3-glycerol phosphate synthase TrpC [Mariprofundaceae bacterium]